MSSEHDSDSGEGLLGPHLGPSEERDSPAYRRNWVGGWTAPLLVAGGTLIWVMLIWWLIGDRAPVWKHGVVPYVPGSSIFAIQKPGPADPPAQVVFPEDTIEEPESER